MHTPPEPDVGNDPAALPSPPPLLWMGTVTCEVGAFTSLGDPAKHGERRFVPVLRGQVAGPELNGELIEGGVDWQLQRADGATETSAHYAVRTPDGALIEVQSDGLRHGRPEVMALADGRRGPTRELTRELTRVVPDFWHIG